jgi:hypothetical protein
LTAVARFDFESRRFARTYSKFNIDRLVTNNSREGYPPQSMGEIPPPENFMTNRTTSPIHQVPLPPMAKVSINDDLPTSSPTPKSTLIGFSVILGLLALSVLYYKTIGF